MEVDYRQELTNQLQDNLKVLKDTLEMPVELNRLEDRWEMILLSDGLWRAAARFELSPLPGCAAIAVTSRSEVLPEFQGRGIGRALHEYRIMCAKQAKCALMICTVDATNEAETHILETHGWTRQRAFLNPQTGHKVVVWMKKLI